MPTKGDAILLKAWRGRRCSEILHGLLIYGRIPFALPLSGNTIIYHPLPYNTEIQHPLPWKTDIQHHLPFNTDIQYPLPCHIHSTYRTFRSLYRKLFFSPMLPAVIFWSYWVTNDGGGAHRFLKTVDSTTFGGPGLQIYNKFTK